MELVVYVLGAGFSAPLGLPVMGNFLTKSKDLFAQDPERYAHFKDLFAEFDRLAKVKNFFKTDLFNIEEILSLLEMLEDLGGSALERSFEAYLCDVVEALTPVPQAYPGNLPENWHGFLFRGPEPLPYYGYFVLSLFNMRVTRPRDTLQFSVSDTANRRYAVVSLNYDAVLELQAAFIGERYGYPLAFVSDAAGEGVPLAKLHGSVTDRRVIPPTWKKRLDTAEIERAWSLAHDLLASANHVRIVGYSLPESDTYVKYLFRAAALKSMNLKTFDVLTLDDRVGTCHARYDGFVDFPYWRFRSARVETYLSPLLEQARRPGMLDRPLDMTGLEAVHERLFETG